MASSNRHWPSMFKKSKPSNPNHQWQQHDTNSSHIPTGSQRSPFTPGAGGDERSPEPKPRWNPKPEQIRILEAIFNSGMVNPPRDEIRKIRIQLQEYGQVGDANVFYWFQNRKSRSKHKLRHLHNSSKNKQNNPEAHQNSASNDSLPQITALANSSSSSSSSEKSSPKEMIPIGFSNVNDGTGVPNSPSEYPSVNNQQAYFQTPNIETNFQLPPPSAEPFSFPLNGQGPQGVVANNNSMMMMTTQGFYLSHDQFSNLIQPQPEYPQNVVPFNNSMLFSEIMSYGNGTSSNNDHQEDDDQDKAMKRMHYPDPQLGFCLTSTPTVVPPIANTPTTDDVPPNPITDASVAVSSPIISTQLQGVGGEADGAAKCTVFINDVAFEVAVGPFNVRQAFGDGAVFIHSSGHPVLTDEWGVTLHPLHHGASYYLI